MRKRRRLSRKYVIVLVALVTGALLASGAVQLYSSFNESKAALVALQAEKAHAAAVRIEGFVKEIERQLGWTTHPIAAVAALDQRRQDFYRLQRQVPPITELGHLDAVGREQLRISRLAMEMVGSQADFSQDPRFLEARKGRTYFGPVYFRKDSEPYMSIAMPQSGGGVTVAEVNLKFILDVISQIKIGKAGLAYTVDANGVLIAHPDISIVLQKTSLHDLTQVRAALVPGEPPVTIARDSKGREVLTAHSAIGPLGWVVFVEQPLEEALEPLQASARRTGILVVAGIVLSMLVSALLGRRMARPIQVLQEGAAKIGAGDLAHRIELRSGDELETLAEEFNEMTGRLRESYATLEQRVEDRTRELTEALEQQTASAEILRVISASPTDVQPVLDAVAENATRVCGAIDAIIMRVEGPGDIIRRVAHFGPVPLTLPERRPLTPHSTAGRAILERRPVQIADAGTAEGMREYPETARASAGTHFRTSMAVPLLREGVAIGAITMRRLEVRPFTDKQIALLQTFADQAVIAIENVRLFKELEEKNRTITEALEQQTATAEILRVISSSPTDVQPVFDTIVGSAARLLGGYSANLLRLAGGDLHLAAMTPISEEADAATRQTFPLPVARAGVAGHVIETRRPYIVTDMESDPIITERLRHTARLRGFRSLLMVPMLRPDGPIGAIAVTRRSPGGFSEDEIALLQTFADQAVIAIENVRLFKALEERNRTISEALEQQTATAEILRVISSSPTDVQPVFASVLESAVRLCGAEFAGVFRFEGGLVHFVTSHRWPPAQIQVVRERFPMPPGEGSLAARAIRDRRVLQTADYMAEPGVQARWTGDSPERPRGTIAVPMLREGAPLGCIVLARGEPGLFSDEHVALLQTFADQAVIAIENVRLFKELEEKNRTITEALEQQTATAEILRVISASPTDVQPVLDAVAENAARVCGASDAIILRVEAEAGTLRRVAHFGALPLTLPEVRPLDRHSISGRAILEGRALHVEDMHAPEAAREYSMHAGPAGPERTILAMPLMREGTAIGAIDIRRTEVRPFSEEQIALLRTFADQAVIAIENTRLFTELQARTAELTRSVGDLEALGEVGRAISSTLDLPTVLSTIVARANELAETDGGAIYEFDSEAQVFRLRATDRFAEDFVAVLRATALVYGEGAVGRAAAARAPVQVADVRDTDAYSSRIRDALVSSGYRSLLAVPLVSEDRVVGALVVNRRVPGEFPPRTVELLRTFATQSALAIQNARLFREIEDKSRELEVANQHKSEFLASVSHELRTPLNAIIGFSEVMLERLFGEVNEKQEEYLNDILSSGRHLLSLINDILDLAKIEAGRMELERVDFDLPQAVDNTLVLVRERALRRGIALERWVDPRLGAINGDERKVKQVLLNLLSNAVKFTPEGGRVEVRAVLADGTAEVSVSDTGVGIAPEDHEAVFEEFRQVGTDYARKHEGTGLGLALARRFVELHGGKIWVKSQVGQGSIFTFTIPVRPWPAS